MDGRNKDENKCKASFILLKTEIWHVSGKCMFLSKIITFFLFLQEEAHIILLKTTTLKFQLYFEKIMIILNKFFFYQYVVSTSRKFLIVPNC